jgi:death-on-curing protein
MRRSVSASRRRTWPGPRSRIFSRLPAKTSSRPPSECCGRTRSCTGVWRDAVCHPLGEVVDLHRRLLQATGGTSRIRDFGALESAVAQPKATFGGVDLYPTLVEKAVALCFSLVQGHPFVDGNKRVGHAAMETFLVLNGTEIDAPSVIKSASCSISAPAESAAVS